MSERFNHLRTLREGIENELNLVRKKRASVCDELESVKDEVDRTVAQFERFLQINILNDAFFVWYVGPFATINGFRLGSLNVRPVEWVEINAALGQAVLAVSTLAAKANLQFKKYYLHPQGSFPKLSKVDDKRIVLQLYIDQSFSLFPKTNFNKALLAFLSCIQEFAEYIGKHDPTMMLPFPISADEGKVNDILIMLGADEDLWTKGLKFMLTDIKWMIAWAAKHCDDSAV